MSKLQSVSSGRFSTHQEPRLGVWRSKYWYPSSSRKGVFNSEHLVQLHKVNRYLVAESLPDNSSYLLIRLTVDDAIATGSWHEQTNVRGYYKGAIYHGAIQLVVSADGAHMKGKWVGFGKDMAVNVGDWQLDYLGKELPG
jgi:hypothetical protein